MNTTRRARPRPRVPLIHVNAFTDRPFGGNPAIVCVLPEAVDEKWMRQVAVELNQPTTAFLHDRRLRWFTPTSELPLCGHATLAAAHVLYETGSVGTTEPVVFETTAGPLRARSEDGLVWVGFTPVALREETVPGPVLEALDLDDAVWFGCNDHEYVVMLDTADQVEAVRPDLARIRRLPVSRILVTAAGGDDVDFTSRVFAPVRGLDEDQVTGSAHAVLGPFWAERLGRRRFDALQASSRRGRLRVIVGDGHIDVGGHAVTLARGEWAI
ncbi:PhzF family phenazine biosynthesis protein [Nonomuraea sp. NPDC003709]|uniref:PhzF family phenazine biosynthesis protein n=1 Tax=Nonomuraea sp. NPDC003709 TaxID=3154450 RepID=UPI0033A4D3E9